MISSQLALCETAFLTLPLIVLSLRFCGPRWFGGWTAALCVAIFGWFLANACIHLSFAQACETMESYGDNPPQNIADDCTVDGAALVFGAMFGWLYALIYYTPFLLIYEIARRICLARRTKNQIIG